VPRDRLHPALAWVCAEDGTPYGAGTLVGSRLFLTCAHVVASALGMSSPGDMRAPDQPVYLRFTKGTDHGMRRAKTRADRWFPPGPSGEADAGAGDVALLDLLDDPPPTSQPIESFLSSVEPGYEVFAFGLPAGHGPESGGWASGEVAGPQASGWIQIDSPAEGFRIQPGFSGAAAWSDAHDSVVGMIVASERSPDTRVAWMIPAAFLAEHCPEIVLEAPAAAAAPPPTGPRVMKVTNVPELPGEEILSDQETLGAWIGKWFDQVRIVVNQGAENGVTAGDYFDVLAKHEPIEDNDGSVLGFVDEGGSIVRAVEVQPRFSVCQLENFAYQSFFDVVVPARMKGHGLENDDDTIDAALLAELYSPVVAGEVVKVIPSGEKDARDEVEELYDRSLDESLPSEEAEEIYREMVKRADRFLVRFPSGYFAGPMLYQKGYALFKAGEFQDALDTFELYRRQYPFGSTEGAERLIGEAKTALRGGPAAPAST
jgi:hypothetical protein